MAGLLTAAVATAVSPSGATAAEGRAPRVRPAASSTDGPLSARGPAVAGRSAFLARSLRTALATSGFDTLVDFGAVEGRCPAGGGCPDGAPRVAHVPTVDAAVVELDRAGRVTAVANAVLTRDVPGGAVVDVGADLAAHSVRWYRWDAARWDGEVWGAPYAAADLLAPAPAAARLDVMSPYPGSLFALVVAVHTLRLADAGRLDLDAPATHSATPDAGCGQDGSAPAATPTPRAATTSELLDRALTASDQGATCALLAQLHGRGEVASMNAWLQQVGLRTIHVDDTDPGSGGRWTPRGITMTALDTARLLLLVRGATGALWDDADGRPVRSADVLSAGSRALLLRLLGEQGFNEALSTVNWCGRQDVPAGIPQTVPDRWVDPHYGTVTVAGVPYGQDVRPCDRAAQVRFAHKTGLTYTFGADAGVVDALPGQRERHYVVAVLGTLGSRYADQRLARSPALPCKTDACYPGALARLGAAVDAAVAAPAATPPPAKRPAGGTSGGPTAAGPPWTVGGTPPTAAPAAPRPRRDPAVPPPRLRRGR